MISDFRIKLSLQTIFCTSLNSSARDLNALPKYNFSRPFFFVSFAILFIFRSMPRKKIIIPFFSIFTQKKKIIYLYFLPILKRHIEWMKKRGRDTNRIKPFAFFFVTSYLKCKWVFYFFIVSRARIYGNKNHRKKKVEFCVCEARVWVSVCEWGHWPLLEFQAWL